MKQITSVLVRKLSSSAVSMLSSVWVKSMPLFHKSISLLYMTLISKWQKYPDYDQIHMEYRLSQKLLIRLAFCILINQENWIRFYIMQKRATNTFKTMKAFLFSLDVWKLEVFTPTKGYKLCEILSFKQNNCLFFIWK